MSNLDLFKILISLLDEGEQRVLAEGLIEQLRAVPSVAHVEVLFDSDLCEMARSLDTKGEACDR